MSTVALLVRFTVREDLIDRVLPIILRNAAATRTEDGCLLFCVFQSAEQPGRVTLMESYLDHDAFTAHQASDHFTAYRTALAELPDGAITDHTAERLSVID